MIKEKVPMFFKSTRPPENLQKLSWHIVELNKKQSSVEIINETAICLREILDYQLYAFVFKKGNRLNAWLAPEVDKNHFENLILKDLCIKHKKTLTCMTLELPLGPPKEISTLDDLARYEIEEENCYSKVYMHSPPKKSDHQGDIHTRYGGDEFIVILPKTDMTKAIMLADRLRIKISNKKIAYGGHTINLTASFGVSQLKKNTEMTRMIQDADTMLYKAKSNGRNNVMPALKIRKTLFVKSIR